jgi:hypothetical protein
MIQTIFLKENEKDIFDSLQNQGIDTSKFEKHFIDLFNKMYNNEVGYYIFKQENIVYKVIVLPKTINKNSKIAQKEFIDYLLHYHRVNNKYNFDDTKQIPNSLLSLAFKNNNDENNSHEPIEQFEYYKYKSILESIEKFFKKHKNYKKVNIDYKSQGIKYKLNLAKNIKELDKTKIHQTQSIDMMYSQIATVTYNALKIFNSKRIKVIKDEILKKELVQSTKKVINLISKKYTIDKNFKLTLSKLNNFKTTKIFSKKSDTKLLLVDIKSLFGFEQMYNDKELSVSNRYDLTTTSFFINPSSFYEWYIYDILKDFAGDKYKLLFDKDKDNKTTIEYDLVSKEYKKDNDRSSNPDYILIDKEKDIKIVLDAKWKNIKKLSDIKSSDFLKLKHDTALLENGIYKTIPYLIYPNYLSCEDEINILKEENQYFNFGILQIDMNFDEDKNKIDFKYDYEKIEEQIEKEKFESIVKSSSEQFTDEIGIHRRELIIKLLNSENLEDKEEVFSVLDNELLQSSEKLSERLNEEQLPEEIQQILGEYDKTLTGESKKFLRSSGLIYQYYKNKDYKDFDYSMPASGLWKLVEMELNTSFIWFVRIQKKVCDKTDPWKSLYDRKTEVIHKIDHKRKVELNQFEYDKDRLQGVMLGGIKLLLCDSYILDFFKDKMDIESYINIGLIQNIINYRNEHAHIKAMNLEKFEELYQLLFGDEKNIYKLLDMKKRIKEYIK